MKRFIHLLARDKKGQSLTEFALVSLVLLILFVGIVQFGLIFNAQVKITSAAREGVRWASLGKDAGVVRGEVYNLIKNTPCLNVNGGDIILGPLDEGEYSPVLGEEVYVHIPATVTIIVPFLGRAVGDEFGINAKASMRYQSYD